MGSKYIRAEQVLLQARTQVEQPDALHAKSVRPIPYNRTTTALSKKAFNWPIRKFVRSSECTFFSKLHRGKIHPSVKNINEMKYLHVTNFKRTVLLYLACTDKSADSQ